MIQDFLICLLTLPNVLNHLFPGIVARDGVAGGDRLAGFLPAPLHPHVVHHPPAGALRANLPIVAVVVRHRSVTFQNAGGFFGRHPFPFC